MQTVNTSNIAHKHSVARYELKDHRQFPYFTAKRIIKSGLALLGIIILIYLLLLAAIKNPSMIDATPEDAATINPSELASYLVLVVYTLALVKYMIFNLPYIKRIRNKGRAMVMPQDVRHGIFMPPYQQELKDYDIELDIRIRNIIFVYLYFLAWLVVSLFIFMIIMAIISVANSSR